jgi:hypothetical protein
VQHRHQWGASLSSRKGEASLSQESCSGLPFPTVRRGGPCEFPRKCLTLPPSSFMRIWGVPL